MRNIKDLNYKQLKELCAEIRDQIIRTVDKNGGHLASNLGVVELTVALCYVFDFDIDKIVFDVGHQVYAYKFLTDREDAFGSIRKEGGLSGFPDPEESKYDVFSTGHAGTSLAASLGLAYARDRRGENYYVIDLVGDASLFNGENLEALSASDTKPRKFIVILNDNGKSISKNNNGLYKAVSAFTTKKFYIKVNEFFSKTIGRFAFGRWLRRVKSFFKRLLSYYAIVDKLDLKYVGVFDGHDLKGLIRILKRIKESGKPTLLHIRTTKGKGYSLAEHDSTTYHGIGKNLQLAVNTYSDSVGDILERCLPEHPDLCAITAGMKTGVGLASFAKRHPKNVLDVGIAEDLAVTLAGGMAKGGGEPIVFIYSTFLQRAFDQILNDICLQNLHVVFCVDRAGFVGSDGKTHQGIYDLTYLINLPNMTVLAPYGAEEFEEMLRISAELSGPVAIRYPSGECLSRKSTQPITRELKWEELRGGEDVCIFAVGNRMAELALAVAAQSEKRVAVVSARCVKPLDEEMLLKYRRHRIVTLEENVTGGGFGASVLTFYAKRKIAVDLQIHGIENGVVGHATVERQMEKSGFTVEKIVASIQSDKE